MRRRKEITLGKEDKRRVLKIAGREEIYNKREEAKKKEQNNRKKGEKKREK